MKKVLAVVGAIASVAALAAVGMTATSWASGNSTPPPSADGVRVPTGPHTLATPPAPLEAAFHVITPCRIVDTRVIGGPLAPDAVRTYVVGGTSGFMPQGGKNGGCGIPLGATAIAATLTAPTPTHLGAIRAWPTGESEPTATILAYSEGLTASTGTTLPISASQSRSLTVKNYRGPTNLFIDVTGYYEEQISASISGTGTIGAGAAGIVSVTHAGTGIYVVTLDRDVSNCSAFVGPDYIYGYATTGDRNGHQISVATWLLSGSNVSATNLAFFLTIVC